MTCSCPKCQAQIEVDLTNIPEKGTFNSCPECKGRFWINRESYARMALKKDGATYCDKCAILLDHKIVCSSCGVMYPDFFLVQASKPPRRQVEKQDLFSLSFTLKPVKQTYAHTYSYTSAKETRTSAPIPFLKMVGIAALFILLAFGISYFYNIKKSEQLYAKNYMRTLYTIKAGTDLSLSICNKMANDWKTAGQFSAPRIREEDESQLKSVKETTDRFMQTLNKPPKKFIVSNEKIAKLYDVYSKANTLAVAPAGSLAGFTSSTSKSQSDYNLAVQELKRNLPQELLAELAIAKTKYKGLKDI